MQDDNSLLNLETDPILSTIDEEYDDYDEFEEPES